MSVVKIFTPENRLAKVIGGMGDATAEELAKNAEGRVRALRPVIRKRVQEIAEELALLSERPETEIFAECKALGDKALEICEIAGAADLQAIGDAARGVHALIDALFTAGVWHTEALKLHVESLMVLNGDPPPPAEAARQMLARLRGMREWLGVPE